MSNLSNLFISQSFLGIINLQDSTQNLASQSGDVQLQDGLGDNIGLTINATTKEFTVVNNFKVDGNADFNGNVDISGSLTHTGSIDIIGDLTVTGDITAQTGSFDTLHTRVLHVTTETASVIFSSGSNKLGDEESDRQDLIGQVIVSGTLGVEGDSAFTGSLTVSNEISSSTINGIGNVTTYSSSVDDRLTQLEVSSGSQDSQLSNLENFTASQENINSGYNTFTSSYYTDSASFDNRIDQLEADTGSQDSRLDNLELFTSSQETINGFYNSFTASNGNDSLNTFTSSYYVDSASFDTRIDALEDFSSSLVTDFVTTGSFNSYTASQDNLNNTFATTGSNTFNGAQIITGSVNGNVTSVSIASNTASFDCSLGNFFTVTLPSGSTHLTATNIIPGQTISVKVSLGSNTTNVTTNDTILFPTFNEYEPTQVSGSIDLLSFVSFDTSQLLGASLKKLV